MKGFYLPPPEKKKHKTLDRLT